MKTHIRTGATHEKTRRYARLFSTVEMAVAMSILLVISLGVTFTLTRTLSQTERATQQQGADAALSIALNNAYSQGYSALANDDFLRLDACDEEGGADPLGELEFSCISVAGRTYIVGYEILTPDSDEFAEETEKHFGSGFVTSSEGLLLRVFTEVDGGTRVTQTRRVAPPIPGFKTDYGALRVAVETTTGERAPEGLELFLLNADNQPVAAVANPLELNSGGSVVFVVPDEACTRAEPCQVGISDTSDTSGTTEWWKADPIEDQFAWIEGQFAWGVAGAEHRQGVVVPKGGTAETTLVVFEAGEIKINLYASGAKSDLRIPPRDEAAGSICLWLTFIDDGEPKSVPTCNFDNSGFVSVHSYTGAGGGEYLVPTDTEVTISIDHPEGICPAVDGLKGHTDLGWDNRAVCSSWTWGYPSLISTPGDLGEPDLQPFSEKITVLFEGGRGYEYDLIWAGDSARPAAGYAGEGQWLRPREALGCSLDGTCQPLGETNTPESRDCPGKHCYSTANARPQAIGPDGEEIPAGGAVGVDVEAGSPVVVDLGARDEDRDPVSLIILEVPEVGELRFDNEEVEPGDVIFSDVSEPAFAQLVYYSSPTDTGVQQFRFKVLDTHGANSCKKSENDPQLVTTPEDCQTVNLVLDATAVAEIIGEADPGSVYQGQGAEATSDITVTVLNGHGQPMEGIAVGLEAPAGVTLGATEVVTGADGKATTTANFSGSTPGVKQIKLTAGGRLGEVFVEVLATARKIWTEPGVVRQGSGDNVVVGAADSEDHPAPGIPVTLDRIDGPALGRNTKGYDGEGQLVNENSGRFMYSPLFKALIISQGGGNLVSNPTLADLDPVDLEEVEWDASLNGDSHARGWAVGYDTEVDNPASGYHAHINPTAGQRGGAAWEFIDHNTSYGEPHRPLKARQVLSTNPASDFGWADGSKVTVSFDVKVDHADKFVRVGLEHLDGEENLGYGSTYADLAPGVVDEWRRVTTTFTLNGAEWDFTSEVALVIEGHHANNGTEAKAWVDNISVENGASHTGFHDEEASGLRGGDMVAIPGAGVINPSEGTLSLVFSPLGAATADGVLFSYGSAGEDLLELSWNSAVGENTLRFTVSNGSTTRNVDVAVPGGVQPGEWYRVVARWDLPNTLALDVHRFGGGTSSDSGSAAGLNPIKGQVGGDPVWLFDGVGSAYLGWNGAGGWANIAVDELSVANIYRDNSAVSDLLAAETSDAADSNTTFFAYFNGTDVNYNGVDLGASSCTTGLEGTCQATLGANQDAPAGTYRLTVVSGGLVGYGAVTVEPAAQQIQAPGLVVLRQNGTTEVVVVAVDGAGVPLTERPLTFAESSNRFRIVGDSDQNGIVGATTDAYGVATITLAAESGALPGVVSGAVTISDGTTQTTVDVEIVPAPGDLAYGAVVMEPVDFIDLEVTVYDDNNNPLPGEPVRLTSTNLELFGIGNPEDEDPETDVSTTDANGVATFRIISAFEASPGVHENILVLEAGDLPSEQLDIHILQRIFGVTLSEPEYAVDQGSQVEIGFLAVDNVGNPVNGDTIDDPDAAILGVATNTAHIFSDPASVAVDAEGNGAFTITAGAEAVAEFVEVYLVSTRGEFLVPVIVNPVAAELVPVEDPVVIHRDFYGRAGFHLLDLAGNGMGGVPVTIASSDPDLHLNPVVGFSPLGWWRLNEVSGAQASDRSLNANHGNYSGSVAYNQAGALNGSADTAVSLLDGVTDGHIVLPLTANAHLAESFTFSAWVRVDDAVDTGEHGYILYGGTDAPNAMYLRVDGDTGYLELGIGGYEATTSVSLTEGQWHHVVWTVNDDPFDAGFDSSAVYLDGELVHVVIDPDISAGRPGGEVQLSDDSSGFEVSFDEVAIWNLALDGTHIESMYLTGTTGDENTVLGVTNGAGVLWAGAVGTGVDGEFEVTANSAGVDPATLTVRTGLQSAHVRVIPDNPVYNPSFEVGDFDGWDGAISVAEYQAPSEWQQDHPGNNPAPTWWPLGRGDCTGWELWNNFDAEGSPSPTAAIEVRDPDTLDEIAASISAGDIFFVLDGNSATTRTFEWRELPSGAWKTMTVDRSLNDCGMTPAAHHGILLAVLVHDGGSETSVSQSDTNRFPVLPGDELALRVRMYTTTPGLWANARISLYDSNGDPLDGGTYLVRSSSGESSASYQTGGGFNRDNTFVPTQLWSTYDLVASEPVPAGAAFARVEVFTESSAVGAVYVDSVEVAYTNRADITVPAGGEATVEVELTDFMGAPISGAEVEITEDAPDAVLSTNTVTTDAFGRGSVTLTTSPEATSGDFRIDVTYEAPDSSEVAESQHTLRITGGEAPGLVATYYDLDGSLANLGQGDGVVITASSEATGSPATATVDGVYGENLGYADEWRSDGEGEGAYITFDLGELSDITEVWLYDRVDPTVNMVDGVVELSVDGDTWFWSRQFTGLDADGAGMRIEVGQTARYVRITAGDGATGSGVGLSEVRILGGGELVNLARTSRATATASSEKSSEYLAKNAIDGNVPGAGINKSFPHREWVTAGGTGAGNYLEIDLGRDGWVHAITVYDRPNSTHFGDFEVRGRAANGSSTSVLMTATGLADDGSGTTYVLDRPTQLRYVQLYSLNATGPDAGLAEVEVWGSFTGPGPGDGTAFAQRVVPNVDVGGAGDVFGSGRGGQVGVEFEGDITISEAGEYIFYVDGADDVALRISGQEMVSYVLTDGAGWTAGGVLVGDFNGDGITDQAAVDGPLGDVWVFPGSTNGVGAPQLWASGGVHPDWDNPQMFVGDFDGDGDDDLAVVYGEGNGEVWVLESDGTGFDAPTVWGTLAQNLVHFPGQAGVGGVADDDPSLDLTGDFTIEVTARADWSEPHGRQLLVARASADEFSWGLYLNGEGHLELVTAADPDADTSKVFTSTEPMSVLAESGQLRSISVGLDREAGAVTVNFAVDGSPLGDPVVFELGGSDQTFPGSCWSKMEQGSTITETFICGNYNWEVPAGVFNLTVQAWGGGGGGHGPTGAGTPGDGGGGGAYATSTFSVTPGASYSVSTGAGGAAGSDGGDSIFGSGQVKAAGGQSGSNGAAGGSAANSVGDVTRSGGAGGSGGGTNGGGGGGGAAAGTSNNGAPGQSASGSTGGNGGVGTNGGGSGGKGGNTGASGVAGTAPGGGGGGRGHAAFASQRAGGAGGRGRIVLTYTQLTEDFDLWNGSAPITIGYSEWDDTTLRGDIQRVALFSDLSASELVFEWDATEAVEDAETIVDSSANGIDLTLIGAKVANAFFASRNGNAVLDLSENTSNYNVVGVADDADSLDVKREFAIEFVGRADWTQLSSDQTLVSKWAESDGSRAYYLELTSDGELQLWISTNGSDSVGYLSTESLGDALPGLADGDRLNITASFTTNGAGGDSEVKFYANGVQVGTTVEGPGFEDLDIRAVADSDQPLTIGGRVDCDCAFVGQVERVRISANVAADGGLGSELVGAWEFDRATPGSDTVIDSSGNSNTLSFRAGNAVDGEFPAPESPIHRPFGADQSLYVAADIDGDETDDLVGYDPGVFGSTTVLLGGDGAFGAGEGLSGRSWVENQTLFAGKVNADEHEDLIWFNHDTRTWRNNPGGVNGSLGASVSGGGIAPSGTVPVVGDVNGDDLVDVLNYNPASGDWLVKLGNGSTWLSSSTWATFANPGSQIVKVGDFNGDGKADVAGYNTSTGVWQVGLAQASSFTVATFGTQDNLSAGGVFSLGDYDGDGDTDVVYLHQAPANTWRQLISSGSSFAETAVVAENTNTTGSWECAVASTQTLSGTPQGCSSIHLEPGRHSLWLWAQKSNLGGDIGLKLAYSGPDTASNLIPVPSNVLSHIPEAAPLAIESVDAGDEVVRIRNLNGFSTTTATLRLTNSEGAGGEFSANIAPGGHLDVWSGNGSNDNTNVYLNAGTLWDDGGDVAYLEVQTEDGWVRIARLAFS